MLLPMDIRMASSNARFGFVFARRGIVPEAASSWFLSRLVGMQPVSIALTRQMLWRMSGVDDPMRAHQIDSRALQARGRSADAKEGVSAFLAKRAPVYPDRVSTDMPEFFPWWDEISFR